MYEIIGIFGFIKFVRIYFALTFLKMQRCAKINGKILEVAAGLPEQMKNILRCILKNKKKKKLILLLLLLLLFCSLVFYFLFHVLEKAIGEPAFLWLFLLKNLETLAALNTSTLFVQKSIKIKVLCFARKTIEISIEQDRKINTFSEK